MICTNYRPIWILPILSKIFEKLVHKRLVNYLGKYKLLIKHQYSFQKGKSTEHAILDLHKDIVEAIEKKEKACAIFLNFAKAFDTVNHKILLKKLEYYGVRGVPLIWFQSYLHNRQQCVKINQSTSDSKTITCGVPQGSILEPLLFLININDIFLAAPKVSFHLFADDTCIFHSNKNYRKLEDEINTSLDNITNWLKANKLMINVKKSNLIVFKVGNSQSAGETINIYIENQILEPKDTAKYLGVYIDKRLSWDRHIEHINSKLNRGIGILRKLRSYLQQDSLRTIYNSFSKLYIEYGTPVWGGAPNKYLDKTDKCIKRSMRTMLFKNRFDNVKPFYKHLNIIPLTKNIKLLQRKFMWKLLFRL